MKIGDKIHCALTGKVEECESCGAEFDCGPLWGCWCMKEKVPPEALRELKLRYEHCICPDCLKRAGAGDLSHPVLDGEPQSREESPG